MREGTANDQLLPTVDQTARVLEIAVGLSGLSGYQLDWLQRVIGQFRTEPTIWRDESSDIVTECVLKMFSDALQIHHCFSRQALSKDRFEYSLLPGLHEC